MPKHTGFQASFLVFIHLPLLLQVLQIIQFLFVVQCLPYELE